jgi:hypothetical protein
LALLLRSALCDLKASSPSSRNEGVPCVPRSQRASVAGQARTMAVALARQTIASAARGAPIQLPCKQKIPREPRTRAIAVSASATGGLRNSYWHDAEKPLIGHQFPSAPPRAPYRSRYHCVDVNTVSPPHDVRNVTAFLAAQVIYESLVLLCQKPS